MLAMVEAGFRLAVFQRDRREPERRVDVAAWVENVFDEACGAPRADAVEARAEAPALIAETMARRTMQGEQPGAARGVCLQCARRAETLRDHGIEPGVFRR